MKRAVWFSLVLMAFYPSAHAEDLLDWLQQTRASGIQHSDQAVELVDYAELLTLEPGENEMRPRVSPDGKTMLVASGKRRKMAITLRLIENGDPLSIVSEDDDLALASYAWHGPGHISFLSHRAGGTGLWEKPVNGRGAIRRLHRLVGDVADPVVLDNGSLIVVRLFAEASHRHRTAKRDSFSSWQTSGMQAHLVHISKEGAENDLASGLNPAISPDGQNIVFSMKAGRSRHLFMMNVDGSDLVQLTDERSIDVQPAWSSDGMRIVFTSNRARPDMKQQRKSDWNIWIINRDGRNLTQLTYDKARDGGPNVGADGRVYFHSDRKISSMEQKAHQVKGRTSGFHIWSVNLPVMVR